MRIDKTIVLLSLAAILVLGTAAQDNALKFGVVDIDQAISSTEQGKNARDEFTRKQREAEAQIQPLIERYRSLEEDFKAKKFVLSEDALAQKQYDLLEMRNQIQNKMKELEGQVQIDQKRLEGPLIKKLSEIVDEVGKAQGFTMIFHRGAPGILYVREALDITDTIIERFNQKG